MISLFVAMCTFRKQWTFFEILCEIDEMLTKDFSVITPKKVFRIMSILVITLVSGVLLALVCLTYYVYNAALGIPSLSICLSYFLANLPYCCVIMIFFFTTSAITRRFYYVNNILLQLASNHMPKNVFEVCSRTSMNDRYMPTIELNEIYSIYGGYAKKGWPTTPPYKNQNEMKKEMKKLTTKLESREESTWKKFARRNVIDVEEFKLAKMKDPDEIIEHLTKLLDIHDMLLDCINMQNEILSFQILLIVAQIFVFEVFALFSLYRTLYNTTPESNVLAIANVFWFVIYNFILYFIMTTASECVYEGKLAGTCCHKVINKVAHTADQRIVEKVIKA